MDSDGEYVASDNEGVNRTNSARTSSRRSRANGTRRSAAQSTSAAPYAWEDRIQRTWDTVQEDEAGSLATVVAGLLESSKRRRFVDATPVQRGIIRHMVLVIDMSDSMSEKDIRPTRAILTYNYAVEFVTEFFEQNPLSQMAILGMRDGISHVISPLGGSPHDHTQALRDLRNDSARSEPRGAPSLQNALEMARALLYHLPSHGLKEVLIIYGSLVTNDPGDIYKTVDALVRDKIRVRIIGLAAQVLVCSEICKRTNSGSEKFYGVILNEANYKDLLHEATTPPATIKPNSSKEQRFSALVKMGFPSRKTAAVASFSSIDSSLSKGGYLCPNCNAKVPLLPVECPICSLTLILSTHLARSFHHLVPLESWKETNAPENTSCYACQSIIPSNATSSICPKCSNTFCLDCDIFAHDMLHNCPGCLS
ncbi:hypothetical protein CANCADRAFT_105044 [Tortispora caseinolytica NRRL Y-17796]|uniref:General transcription and DNA repair factor IIH n=1 Tax=Tortispora caseinolytica NRRL Y-17796 TaxID=767744 RepID=A0A1E4TEX5_9ASCO|nr:hypothetical protein CANCADRAFT_105044 [Tortispora caseinolytica NRRL Y-17796]